MNDSFYSLKEEKQKRIINSAMKIFSKSPYRKASTDDIAALADISKGSLFYHFKNKKELYCYLYEYSCQKIYQKIYENHALDEKDFFERNMKIVNARIDIMLEYPYMFEFSLHAYYETEDSIADDIKLINDKILQDAYLKLNKDIDTSRFRNSKDINKAVKMMIWIGDGFIKDRIEQGKLDLKEIQKEACEYMQILKYGFYKHEEKMGGC